jgi:hypothetical protein
MLISINASAGGIAAHLFTGRFSASPPAERAASVPSAAIESATEQSARRRARPAEALIDIEAQRVDPQARQAENVSAFASTRRVLAASADAPAAYAPSRRAGQPPRLVAPRTPPGRMIDYYA